MKSNGNKIKPNNSLWNIWAVFLLLGAWAFLRLEFSAEQDLFHYLLRITTIGSFFISSIGVFAYSNNRAIFFQKFWASYFYAYGLFVIIYNVHCIQLHSASNFGASLINLLVNVGVVTVPTLYVLYRYAFVRNSF